MNSKEKNVIFEVLRGALRREIEAFNYYHKSAQRARFQQVKSLFMQLAEEERKHRVLIFKELENVSQLLSNEKEDSFIRSSQVRYTLPHKIPFMNLKSPRALDLAAVSLPSEFFGGDHLEAITIEKTREIPALSIFLFDVMGHGLEASSLKAAAKKAFGQLHEAWMEGRSSVNILSSHEVMHYLNQKLMNSCQKLESYISAFYGVLDFADGTLTYTSGGHEPPIVIKSDGGYEHLNTTELILGVEEEVPYSEVMVPLRKGDIFVLFSDGITEVLNNDEEMFGRERLLHVLKRVSERPPTAIIEEVFNVIREFSGDGLIVDDFTMAVIKLKALEKT